MHSNVLRSCMNTKQTRQRPHSVFIPCQSQYDRIAIVMSWRTIKIPPHLPQTLEFPRKPKRLARVVFWLIVGIFLLQRSDLEPGDQVERVRAFTRPIEFDYITWTWDALWVKGAQIGLGSVDYMPAEEHSQIVLDYLAVVGLIQQVEREINNIFADPNILDPETESRELRKKLEAFGAQRSLLGPLAESVFQNQLSATAADLGLTLGGQPVPPVLYHVTPLPRALVVSPRDVIRQDASISLIPEITIDQRLALEGQVDQALDVSSLVVNIGGVGLYPTMVMETTSINWLAEVVSHEWVHNFLTLRPLGASYGASPELRIINETVANLAEKEIGGALIRRFYPEFVPSPPEPSTDGTPESVSSPDPPAFDYRAEMHETRVTTDALLADGRIEEAEAYMEVRRQLLWENGYRIRKLNQAYFAFYGAYADQPGGPAGAAENPIGDAVRKLRSQSSSLVEFLNRISWMWSLEQLQGAVEQ
jgi:hypothetical protein